MLWGSFKNTWQLSKSKCPLGLYHVFIQMQHSNIPPQLFATEPPANVNVFTIRRLRCAVKYWRKMRPLSWSSRSEWVEYEQISGFNSPPTSTYLSLCTSSNFITSPDRTEDSSVSVKTSCKRTPSRSTRARYAWASGGNAPWEHNSK